MVAILVALASSFALYAADPLVGVWECVHWAGASTGRFLLEFG